MASSDSVDTKYFYRIVIFGLPKNACLNEHEMQLLFNPVKSRYFICVSHDPSLTPDIREDYDKIHYHILTHRSKNCESFWDDKEWNTFFEKVDELDGWTKTLLCSDLPKTIADFRMPGKEILIDRMDSDLSKAWFKVSKADILEQVSKKKKLFLNIDNVKVSEL